MRDRESLEVAQYQDFTSHRKCHTMYRLDGSDSQVKFATDDRNKQEYTASAVTYQTESLS